MFNLDSIKQTITNKLLGLMAGEQVTAEQWNLGRVAAREVCVIHDRFEQLNVRANVDMQNVVASDTGNFIRYPLIAFGKIASIEAIEDDLSMAISTLRGVETEVHIRKPLLAIELPYPLPTRPLLWSDAKLNQLKPFQALLGMDYTRTDPAPALIDFAKRHVGHVLVAGASGSGKTVELINLIVSLCYSTSPEDLQIIFIDSKYDEDWSALPGLPHVTMVNEPAACAAAIASVRAELERRKPNPDKRKILLIADEYADLRGMLGDGGDAIDADVRAITNIGRSKGVHLLLCTQKPVADLVDTVGKANMTSRVGLQVMTPKESEIAMGRGGVGCENLPGLGAFYAIVGGGRLVRGQSYLLEGENLDQAIDDVSAKWADVDPYRIEMLEVGGGVLTMPMPASAATKVANEDAANAAKILERFTYAELFDDSGNARKGMQLAAVKTLFGDSAENAGKWHRVTASALNYIKLQHATSTTE